MHLGYHGNGRHFDFFQSLKSCHTLRGIFIQISWSLMKGINIFLNPPFFCFHGNCGKVCPTDSDFLSWSRSTRCGCCSYQVSSISVWRVTCYDHFYVFHFFSILAVSMATAAISEKSTLKGTTSHGIWYSYKVSSSLIKASPRNVSDKLLTEERKKKKNNNNKKKRSKHNMSPIVWEP